MESRVGGGTIELLAAGRMGDLVQLRQVEYRALGAVMYSLLGEFRDREAIACEPVCNGAFRSDKMLIQGL